MLRSTPAVLLSAALWLAFVLLVVTILFVLLRACGLVLPGYGAWHRVGFAYCLDRKPVAQTDAQRLALLRDQVLRLEMQLLRQRASCLAQVTPPPRATPQPRQVAETPRPPSPDMRTPSPGARPPETAGREPPPPAPPARRPSSPDAAFPEEKWEGKDLAILNGCWQLGREIKRPPGAREKNPDICLTIKAVRLCMDAAGAGKAEVRGEDCPQPGASSCEAPLTGAFAGDGTLRLTTKPSTCPDNGHWPKTVFTCRRVDDKSLKCGDPSGGEDLEFRR